MRLKKNENMYASFYISQGIYEVPLFVLTNFENPDGFCDYRKLNVGIDKLIVKFGYSNDYVKELITGMKIPIGYFYNECSKGLTAYIYDAKNKTPYFVMIPFFYGSGSYDNYPGFYNSAHNRSSNLLDYDTNKLDNIMKEYREKYPKEELEKTLKDILETTIESYNEHIENKKSNYEKYFSDSELDNIKQDSSNSRFVNSLRKYFKKNEQK